MVLFSLSLCISVFAVAFRRVCRARHHLSHFSSLSLQHFRNGGALRLIGGYFLRRCRFAADSVDVGTLGT